MHSLILTEIVGGLGVLTLHRPQALNALSLEMVREISSVLRGWATDSAVQGVLLRGSAREVPRSATQGKQAATHFCAGGDIRFMHDAAKAGDLRIDDFFTEEYALDHLIHVYPKPVICWLEGVVMGGGMGLAQGCSQRLVTEHVRMAMPETRIGLFPDVAGGYFLSRLPGAVGEYLGVVGPHLLLADALALGLADAHVQASSLPILLDAFKVQPVHGRHDVHQRLQDHISQHALVDLPPATITAELDRINLHFSHHTLTDIVASLQVDASEWARQTLEHMSGNSPLMMSVALEQIRRARSMPLADVFRMERNMVRHCFNLRPGASSETVEGIRALAVDKDHQPRWSPATLAEVTDAAVEAFFEPTWPAHMHPLRDLQDLQDSSNITE
jgi:enoyl-CoA hydratase/carnithine racemase